MPAPVLRCTTEAVLPVELATLLIPISTAAANLGVLEPFTAESKGASVSAYRYSSADAGEHLFVFATAPGGWQIGPWSSDARFLFFAPGRERQPDCFVMCDGSYLVLNGRRVVAAREHLKYAELFFDGDRPRFRCSDPDAVHIGPITEAGDVLRPDVLAAVLTARPRT
jgi:hypothetical protein